MINELEFMLDDGAYMPLRAHSADAGLDIRSPIDVVIPATINKNIITGSRVYENSIVDVGSISIDTGVHVNIPDGYVGFLKSKSGLNVKHGIISTGVIDSGYTGSIVVKLYNLTHDTYKINKGDKITQLVILPIETPKLIKVLSFEETDRGDKGFGSTGD